MLRQEFTKQYKLVMGTNISGTMSIIILKVRGLERYNECFQCDCENNNLQSDGCTLIVILWSSVIKRFALLPDSV